MPTVRRAQLARATVLFTIAGLTLAACRKKPAPAPTPAPTTTVNQDSIDAARRAREEADRRAREAAARDSAARAQARLDSIVNAARATLNAPVYFDYDAADLRDDARGAGRARGCTRRSPGCRCGRRCGCGGRRWP